MNLVKFEDDCQVSSFRHLELLDLKYDCYHAVSS